MAEKNNGAGNGKTEEPEEIIPVGPGSEVESEEVHAEDEEQRASAAGEDEDEEDERVGRAEDEEDDDRSSIRARRKREKLRRREREKSDRVELKFLRQRNEQLERRQSEQEARFDRVDVNQVDARIAQLDEQIREAESLHGAAISAHKGPEATEALQLRDTFRDEKQNLLQTRQQVVNRARQRQQQGNAPAMDPVIRNNLSNWMEDNNDWFDPNLQDEDSRLAKTIEDNLFAEGRLDARTPEYWKEFNRRLAKRGIGRVARSNERGRERDRDDEDDQDDEEETERERPQKRVARGPRITTGGRERAIRKNEVYVSAERREAMIEAGVWDNPTLRQKYLKQYANYDREHRGDRRR